MQEIGNSLSQVDADHDARRARARQLHAEGHSYAEIGRQVGVSGTTAKKYCRGLPPPKGAKSNSSRALARSNPRNNEAEQATEAEQAFTLRLQGKSAREIARVMGCDPRTVRRMIDDEIESRVVPGVEKLRAIRNAELEAMKGEAWQVLLLASGTEMALKAIDRLVQISRRQSALNGEDSPVRVDLVATTKGQAELELEEMIREAQARNAVVEQRLIVEGEIVGEGPQ